MKFADTLSSHIKRQLQRSGLYFLASKIKNSLKSRKIISLKPVRHANGHVLVSYISHPSFLKDAEALPNNHTNYWESLQIARTFLDLGYCVDIIDFQNRKFLPKKAYSYFVGHRINFERIASLLNKNCVKILHIDAAHILFHNAAEAGRLLALQQRKGVTLRLRRFEWPNLAIEHADCATILGNAFTISTYRYANKPIYRIPVSTPVLYPWPEDKDWEACRRHFLWFSSFGFVHKGLDLVLDAFAGMPDYELTVCGPIDGEEDFKRAYHKELYQTPNIHTIDWVDISSPKFTEITNRCIGFIYPSCSEGQCGGVVTCLHAGLIPLISYESGVDVDPDSGFILKDCSIEEIRNSMRAVSRLSGRELKRMARTGWEFARANHTREKFAEEYRKAVLAIMATFGHKELSPEKVSGARLDRSDHAQRSAYIQ